LSFVTKSVILMLGGVNPAAYIAVNMTKSSDILTRRQIIEAAEETLRRYGIGKTSVVDVAKVLGVSHGTLYRHFKSKAELLEAVTQTWLTEKILLPLSLMQAEPDQHGIQHAKAYLWRLSELKQEYARKDSELFTMYAMITASSAQMINHHVDEMIAQLSQILSQSKFEQATADSLARSLLYATTRFHHPSHAYEWSSSLLRQEFDTLWSMLERGLLSYSEERRS